MALQELIGRTKRILSREPKDKNKLYTLHAPKGAPLRIAILLQVGDLYENRKAGAQGTVGQNFVNPAYDCLPNPPRAMTF